MKKEIINKVENSSLKTIDLDLLVPKTPRVIFDIKNWLKNDLILIEKVQNENSIGKDQNFFNVIVNEKIKEGNIVACVYTGISNDMLIAKRI